MERELWILLYGMATRLDKEWGHWKYSTADIVVVYFWSVLHDRSMCWGVEKLNWPEDLCPKCLPSQATLSRRMRRDEARQLMTAIEAAWLGLVGVCMNLIRMIDGKPLARQRRQQGCGCYLRTRCGRDAERLQVLRGVGHGPLAACLGVDTDEHQRKDHGSPTDSLLARRWLFARRP